MISQLEIRIKNSIPTRPTNPTINPPSVITNPPGTTTTTVITNPVTNVRPTENLYNAYFRNETTLPDTLGRNQLFTVVNRNS